MAEKMEKKIIKRIKRGSKLLDYAPFEITKPKSVEEAFAEGGPLFKLSNTINYLGGVASDLSHELVAHGFGERLPEFKKELEEVKKEIKRIREVRKK